MLSPFRRVETSPQRKKKRSSKKKWLLFEKSQEEKDMENEIENPTFIVGDRKFKFEEFSFIFLSPQNTFRQLMVRIMANPFFDQFITFVIVLNSIMFGITDYSYVDDDNHPIASGSIRNQVVIALNIPFLAIFICEAFVKILGMGFFGKDSYTADAWNWLDLIIVIAGIIEMSALGDSGLSITKTFRLLRAVRMIEVLPGLRRLVDSLTSAIPSLGGIFFLLVFFLVVFAAGGLQLWGGPSTHAQCRATPFPVTMSWHPGLLNYTKYRCLDEPNFNIRSENQEWTKASSPWSVPRDCQWPLANAGGGHRRRLGRVEAEDSLPHTVTRLANAGHRRRLAYYNDYGQHSNQGEGHRRRLGGGSASKSVTESEGDSVQGGSSITSRLCSLSGMGNHKCHYGTWCGSLYDAYGNKRFLDKHLYQQEFKQELNFGFTVFDSFGQALISVFQCATANFWTTIMYQTMDAYTPLAALYFIVLIFVATVYILQLFVAALEHSFHENSLPQNRRKKRHKSRIGTFLKAFQSMKGGADNKEYHSFKAAKPVVPDIGRSTHHIDVVEELQYKSDSDNSDIDDEGNEVEHEKISTQDPNQSTLSPQGLHVEAEASRLNISVAPMLVDLSPVRQGRSPRSPRDSAELEESSPSTRKDVRSGSSPRTSPRHSRSTIKHTHTFTNNIDLTAGSREIRINRKKAFVAQQDSYSEKMKRLLRAKIIGTSDLDEVYCAYLQPLKLLPSTLTTIDPMQELNSTLSQTCVERERFHSPIRDSLRILVHSKYFNAVSVMLILINTGAFLLDHYPMSEVFSITLDSINVALSFAFFLELVAIMLGEGVAYYFQTSYRLFDALVVLASVMQTLISRPPVLGGTSSEAAPGIMNTVRCLRLFRILKLVSSLDSIKMLLHKVSETFLELRNFLVLLFIFLYIFTTLGMANFANTMRFADDGSPTTVHSYEWAHAHNRPRWNFDDFSTSLLTIFQVLTLEAWSLVMFDIRRGNGSSSVLFPILTVCIGTYCLMNLYIAILLSNFVDMPLESILDSTKSAKVEGTSEEPMNEHVLTPPLQIETKKIESESKEQYSNDCSEQRPVVRLVQPSDSKKIRDSSSSAVESAVVVEGCATQLVAAEAAAEATLEGIPLDDKQHTSVLNTNNSNIRARSAFNSTTINSDPTAQTLYPQDKSVPTSASSLSGLSTDTNTSGQRHLALWQMSYEQITQELSDWWHHFRIRDNQWTRGYFDEHRFSDEHKFALNSQKTLGCFDHQHPFRVFCSNIVKNHHFENLIMVIIVLASISLAWSDPLRNPNSSVFKGLAVFDIAVNIIFTCECFLKIVTYGLIGQENAYLRNGWNVLDFTVILLSDISILGEVSTSQSTFKFINTIRVLRALRPLRLISRVSGMKILINSLIGCVPDAIHVFGLMLLLLSMFAVMATTFLKGDLRKCHGSSLFYTGHQLYVLTPYEHLLQYPKSWYEMTVEEKSWFGPYSPFGLSNCSSWPQQPCCSNLPLDRVPTSKNICHCWNGQWSRSFYFTFDNFGASLLTFFQISTLEAWIDLAYAVIDSNGIDMHPIRNNNLGYVYFFILFIICANFFALNLFIGVMLNNFRRIHERHQHPGDDFLTITPEQKEWVKTKLIASNVTLRPKIKKPTNGILGFFYKITHNKFMGVLVNACVIGQTVVFCLPYFGMPDSFRFAVENANTAFAMIFTWEVVLKLIGIQLGYFNSYWNIFDFTITIITDVGVFYIWATNDRFSVLVSFCQIIRILRIFRLLKWFQRGGSLLDSIIFSLPGLFNITCLLILVLYIFAVVAVQLFAKTMYTGRYNEQANFRTFSNALLTLVRFSTGELWDLFMYDASAEPAGCVKDPPYNPDYCGFEGSDPHHCIPLNGCGSLSMFPFLIGFIIIFTLCLVNVFIGVILDGFMSANDSKKAMKPKDFGRFARHWVKYDEHATYFITLSQLEQFMATLDYPMGFGNVDNLTYSILINRLQSSHIYVYHGGLVNFRDVLISVFTHLIQTQKGGQLDLMKDKHELHKELDFHSGNTIIKGFHGEHIQIKHFYAALAIQSLYRVYFKRRKMNNTRDVMTNCIMKSPRVDSDNELGAVTVTGTTGGYTAVPIENNIIPYTKPSTPDVIVTAQIAHKHTLRRDPMSVMFGSTSAKVVPADFDVESNNVGNNSLGNKSIRRMMSGCSSHDDSSLEIDDNVVNKDCILSSCSSPNSGVVSPNANSHTITPEAASNINARWRNKELKGFVLLEPCGQSSDNA